MKTDYSNRTFSCDVASKLRYLQNKKLQRTFDATSLYNIIADTEDLNEFNSNETWTWYFDNHWVDTAGLRSVQLVWFLKCLFTACDMTLDTSEVEDIVVARDKKGSRGHEVYTDIQTKNIVMDLDSIWCIGQDVAAEYTTINDSYYDRIISMYDLVRIVCGYFGIVIVPTDISSFKLIHKSALTELDLNEVPIIHDYDKVVTTNKYDSLENNYRYTRRDKYYTGPKKTNDLDVPSDAQLDRTPKNYMGIYKPAYAIHWFNNLWFMVRSTTDGKCDYNYGQWGIAGNYDKSLNSDFSTAPLHTEIQETVQIPDVTSNYNLLSNRIIVKEKEKRSIIVKSTLI